MDNENKEHIGAPSSRDYVPLTKKNRQELRSRIVDAFTRLDRRSALANRGEENPFVRMFNPRLSVAILLLSLGFTLIFLVFLGLPYLSRKFEEVQRTTFLNGPQQLLTDVQKHLNSDDFASLRTQTGSLETSFNGLRKSLEDLNSFTRALHESSSSGTLASQTLSVETEKLKQATNDFHSAIVSLGGLSGTPAAPTTPPVAAAPTLLDQVTKLNEQVASMVEPQELEDLRKKIVSDVPGIEGEASKKLSNVITYWRESESYYNDGQWRKFTKEDYVALDKLTLPAASNQNLENTKLFLDKIANIPALHRVEPQTKALLVTFNERVHAVSDSENAIAESSKRVEMAEVALNSAITSLKDNTVLTKMDEQSNAIYATVATAADTMQRSRQSYDDTTVAMKKLETAASNLDSIAQLQRELAFKGASPAAFLLFAIGGMFVTIGSRSLLKWVQDGDQKRADEHWRNRTELYSSLAIALIEQGVDPGTVLRRLQTAFPISDKEFPVQTPISETLSELVQILKSKSK